MCAPRDGGESAAQEHLEQSSKHGNGVQRGRVGDEFNESYHESKGGERESEAMLTGRRLNVVVLAGEVRR